MYEEHGYDTPHYLNGIFAFALYDTRKNILYCCRDYAGIKPLFYYHKQGLFMFASEIKPLLQNPAITRELNHETLHYALNLRYTPFELTLFNNILKLRSGHNLIYSLSRKTCAIKKYWNPVYAVNRALRETDAIEGIRHYLSRAVKRQLMSDVPLGAYLSGGIDSSAIVACASSDVHHLKTFSIGFDEPTDEVDDARAVSDHFKTDFYETHIALNPLQMLPEVLWHVEEPKVNMIQGYALSKFARQHVKVALSGLGGDELFAGYANNKFLNFMQFLHRVIPQTRLADAASHCVFSIEQSCRNLRFDEARRGLQMLLSYGNKTKFYLILRNVWDYDAGFSKTVYAPDLASRMAGFQTKNLFEQFFVDRAQSIVTQSLDAELNTKLIDDFLVNEDRTSMAHGLEVRVPFLDRDLVAFALTIPPSLKIRGLNTKYIFRKAMSGILPDYVLRKKKWGFAINPYHQFLKDLEKTAQDMLSEKRIREQGIFNYRYIQTIIDHPVSPRLRWHYYYLWYLVGFQYWHDMFIKNNGASRPTGQ
jgi:asparagine synthase (glutamine-hydrolysing)